MAYAIVVILEVRREGRQRFLDLVRDNAAASVAAETGCQRFDVLAADSGDVFLYEIYDDHAAFDAHLGTPHFKAFDVASRELVLAKRVVTGTLFEQARAAG